MKHTASKKTRFISIQELKKKPRTKTMKIKKFDTLAKFSKLPFKSQSLDGSIDPHFS